MTYRLIVAVVVICLGAGCRDPGPESDRAASNSGVKTGVLGADRASPMTSSIKPPQAGLKRPLPAGIDNPTFAFHVSLDRDTRALRDGRLGREVGLELLGASPQEAEAQFSENVQRAGGSVLSRTDRGASIRIVYELPDHTRMLVWFRPGPPKGGRFALQRTEATGTLYLAWPYVEKSAR